MFLFGITGNLIGPIQLNWSSLRSKIQHFKFSRPRDLDHQRPLWSCGIICWCAGDIVFRVLSPESSVRKKLAKLVVDLWTSKFQENQTDSNVFAITFAENLDLKNQCCFNGGKGLLY